MEFRGVMGGFYRISEWIMRLSVINVLWVICSLPFFFLVVSVLLNPATEDITLDVMKSWLLMLAIVSPFTLIPATTAMFVVARKWVMGDTDVPLFKTYFRGYKENYLQSMLGGLLFVLLGGIIVVNYQFYGGQGGMLRLLSILFITLFFILMAAFFHFISIMVHFHMKLFQILKNSFLVAIGHPILSISMLAVNAAIMYISVVKFNFLVPFFMGSLLATASFWHFNRSYQKMQDRMEKFKKQEESGEEGEGESDELIIQGGEEKDKRPEPAAAADSEGKPDPSKRD